MHKDVIKATIANGQSESGPIDLRDAAGDAGLVGIPSAWTAADLGFKVSDTLAGTYSPLRDESGALVTVSGIITNAAAWYKLPEALRGAMFVKLWSQSAGVAANQGADRAIAVMVKG